MGAVLFIVKDISSPGYHTAMITRLMGGTIAGPTWYLSNASKGAMIVYAAIKNAKRLSMTTSFQDKYPGLVDTMRKCFSSTACRWIHVDCLGEVADYHDKDRSKPVKQRRPMDMIMLALAG